MNQLEADHENLDRLKQDVTTTLANLKARLTAQIPDIRTYDNSKAWAVDMGEGVDAAKEILCEALDEARAHLPTAQEWRRIEEKAERDRLAKG